jgi:hypothetical protein
LLQSTHSYRGKQGLVKQGKASLCKAALSLLRNSLSDKLHYCVSMLRSTWWLALLLLLLLAMAHTVKALDITQLNTSSLNELRVKTNYLVNLALEMNQVGVQPADDRWRKALNVGADGRVPIELIANNLASVDLLVEKATALGFTQTAQVGHVVAGYLSVDSVVDLSSIPELLYARPSLMSRRRITGEGVVSMGVDRLLSNMTGAGVKLCIISDSFDCLGGANIDVQLFDLPPIVTVLKEGNCPQTDEGRAMMQLAYDIAPKADYYFHASGATETDLVNAIRVLAQAGCHVIVDDVGFPSMPFFMDGLAARAVEEVVRDFNVSYLSAAGNDGSSSYRSVFKDLGRVNDIGRLNVWNFTGDIAQTKLPVYVKNYEDMYLVLQWDQSFFSVTGKVGAATAAVLRVYYNGITLVNDTSAVFPRDAYTYLPLRIVPAASTVPDTTLAPGTCRFSTGWVLEPITHQVAYESLYSQ